MNKLWLTWILIISFFLLSALKRMEVSSLQMYFKSAPILKLKKFTQAKSGRDLKEQELLELWESMLTGRSAPLSKWMKIRYKTLGLSHLFTPSGFHLSAVLWPFMKFFKTISSQLFLLSIIGFSLWFLPGFGALKRMVLVKSQQKIFGLKTGFILALVLDILFGSFQSSALSFSYSFLFLGIIYSGVRGTGLFFWFFVAQCILAYFQCNMVSPLLLLLSPILNISFAIVMPLLFFLAVPLWNWQVELGIKALTLIQYLVDLSAHLIQFFPFWEIHTGMLILMGLFLYQRWRLFLLLILFNASSLNLDLARNPGPGTYEFKPQGELVRFVVREDRDMIYFADGKCQRKLVRGYWWEKCSPKKKKRRRTKYAVL